MYTTYNIQENRTTSGIIFNFAGGLHAFEFFINSIFFLRPTAL